MTTIHSNLPLYDAAQNQPSLSRSLRNLSERARPVASQPSEDGGAQGAALETKSPDASMAVELQNRYSALTDPAEAAAVNASAAASIASAPDAAAAAQSLQDAGAVRQLVSDE
jgi:hypothetical protein